MMGKFKTEISLMALASLLVGTQAFASTGGGKIPEDDGKPKVVIRLQPQAVQQPVADRQENPEDKLRRLRLEREIAEEEARIAEANARIKAAAAVKETKEEDKANSNAAPAAPKTEKDWDEFISSPAGFARMITVLKATEAPKVAEERVKKKGALRALGSALIQSAYGESESVKGWKCALEAVEANFKGRDIRNLPQVKEWTKAPYNLPERGGDFQEIRLKLYYPKVADILLEKLTIEKTTFLGK